MHTHKTLGEFRIDKIHTDGSVSITTVNVINNTNVFTLERPGPHDYASFIVFSIREEVK